MSSLQENVNETKQLIFNHKKIQRIFFSNENRRKKKTKKTQKITQLRDDVKPDTNLN